MYLPIIKSQLQRPVISFVDDTSLFSNGDRVKQNMQAIVDTYRWLYKATGSSIQCEKSFYFV